LKVFQGKAAEEDLPQRTRLFEKIRCGLESDSGRQIDWVSKDAGTDGRECHRCKAVLSGDLEGAPVAEGEQFRLAGRPTLPNGPDGMDYELGMQIVSPRDLCLASFASAKQAAFLEQPFARCAMDGAIDATAAKERGIRCVDNRING